MARDAPALTRLAAEEIAARSVAAVSARGRFTLALAGGSTPRALYALLAEEAEPYRGRVPWAATQVFFGDERCVPPDHPDSNYGMAARELLSRVPVPPASVHRMRGEEADPERAALEYEAELAEAFALGEGDRPRLDLVLLGLGPDGHTASLFPGTAALEERSRLVAAPFVPQLGARRLTLTFPVLEAARAVLFLVAGANKAERAADVLERGADLPAARVRPAEGALTWLLDAAAAARLKGPVERAG